MLEAKHFYSDSRNIPFIRASFCTQSVHGGSVLYYRREEHIYGKVLTSKNMDKYEKYMFLNYTI